MISFARCRISCSCLSSSACFLLRVLFTCCRISCSCSASYCFCSVSYLALFCAIFAANPVWVAGFCPVVLVCGGFTCCGLCFCLACSFALGVGVRRVEFVSCCFSSAGGFALLRPACLLWRSEDSTLGMLLWLVPVFRAVACRLVLVVGIWLPWSAPFISVLLLPVSDVIDWPRCSGLVFGVALPCLCCAFVDCGLSFSLGCILGVIVLGLCLPSRCGVGFSCVCCLHGSGFSCLIVLLPAWLVSSSVVRSVIGLGVLQTPHTL